MTDDKEIVFYPCGHYHTCKKCANELEKCPMCLNKIIKRILRDEII